MQYLVCCLCLSIGKPFRKEFYYNPFYLFSVVFMMVYQIYTICYQDSWNIKAFAFMELPWHYREFLLIMVAANSVCSYFFEKVVVLGFARYWNNKHHRISREKMDRH